MAKGNKTASKKDRCSVGRATLRLDDDDWDDGYEYDYNYDYDYDYDTIIDDDFDSSDDEYKPQRVPLTVNLLSIHKQSAATAMAVKHTKTRRRGEAATKEERPAPKNVTEKLLAPVDVETRRRLVRSNSCDVDGRSNEASSAAPRLGQRRSKSASRDSKNSAPAASCSASCAVHCIQSLIPGRPSIIGARASMLILSDKCRTAVLVTWSYNHPQLQVIPLVGCNTKTALRMKKHMIVSIGNCSVSAVDYLSYWRLSTILNDRRDEWVQLLEDLILGDDRSSPSTTLRPTLMQGYAKAWMTLGHCFSPYDMLKQHAEQEAKGFEKASKEQEAAPTMKVETKPSTTTLKDDRNCLVCFEQVSDVDDRYCQLLPCGHVTCLDCYKAYLQSAANSGQGSIRCAAFQCNVLIGIHDAAHILFHGNNETATNDGNSNLDTFQRLVRFTLERSTPRGARFCPSPNCDRILLNNRSPISSGTSSQGFNLLLCDCGTSLCADCETTNGAAHPGVPCAEFTKIQKAIDSGRMDDDLETVKWVLRNSRPCPKCQYPIQKDGGCNHVRCQKCSNYFCFQCGGEGQRCMAFNCKNTEKYWHDHSDTHYDGNLYKGLGQLVDKYRAYRMTSATLSYLIEKMNCGSSHDGEEQQLTKNVDGLLMEIQCRQVLLWIHSATISRMMTSDCKEGPIKKSAFQLELVLHVLSLRGLMQETQIKRASRQEALAAVLGLSSPRKRVSVCKQKAKERRGSSQKSNDLSAFDRLFVDQELQELCQMNATKFAVKAKDVIHEAIKSLLPVQAKNTTRRRNKGNSNKNDETNIKNVYPLNPREKRPNYPWRNGFAIHDETAVDDWADDGNRSNKSRRSWKKGKTQVCARRNAAVDISSIVIDAGL